MAVFRQRLARICSLLVETRKMSLSGTQEQNIPLHQKWKGAVSMVGEALSAFWRLER